MNHPYSNDNNEIDLDSDNDIPNDTTALAADHDHMQHHKQNDDEVSLSEPKFPMPQQYVEQDDVVSITTAKTEPRSATEATSDSTMNSTATTAGSNSNSSMKVRLNLLKQKINQAKILNQQAVREEGEATTAAILGNSSNKKSNNKKQKQMTYEDTMAQQLANQYSSNNNIDSKDMKDLVQPAYVNMKKQYQQQEQQEIQQYAINDYHNPEGQYRNFQRNMNHLLATTRDNNHHHTTDSDTASAGFYDPTDVRNSHTVKNERDGAHRIALELQRRYEKRDKKQLKRKQEQIRTELNNTTSSSSTSNTGGTGINLRNQKFNEKIARTYNPDTAEIRHNLERGTAL